MARKRYSYSRRIVIIPSIFLCILFIQHIFFARYYPKLKRSSNVEKIQIRGQWKHVRRQLGLSNGLPDEILVVQEAESSTLSSPHSISSRFFKFSKRSLQSPNALPELYFSSDSLDAPMVSYDELRESLQKLMAGDQGTVRRGSNRARKREGAGF
ncbi:hypothetical protein D9757_007217 [Collybiopsis confluens]|uniref:Uncharacterized protein n=1 Tax=Collybiopsis confluens TaxID=2823264 RepID=A0A8H5M407_9AGAR|nr:hypothetical protein D9757_007217 [Collybiopsis confluens]